MSIEAPVQPATLVRYGHQAGDILKLLIRSGERVTRVAEEGPPVMQEVEKEFLVAQAVAQLSEETMVVENRVRSATFRRDQQSWEIDVPSDPQNVTMLRSGAELGVDPGQPLAPFVFPSTAVSVGDGWDAVATLSLRHCEAVEVTLRCTVVEAEQPGRLVVEMKSEELQLGGIAVQVSGRFEFSTVYGCMLLGALGNVQRGQEGPDKVEWCQWMLMQLVDRIGVEEFAVER